MPGLHFSHCNEPFHACNGQHEPLEKQGKENSQLLCLLPAVLSIKFILLRLLAHCSACVSFAMHLALAALDVLKTLGWKQESRKMIATTYMYMVCKEQ